MKYWIVVIATLAIASCASQNGGKPPKPPGKETEAVRDFIVVSELRQVDKIRNLRQHKYIYVNDQFIVLPTRNLDYLIEFRGRCEELRSKRWMPGMIDIRVSARVLHADFDTIRGCKIGKIYELPAAQLEELRFLGDAPGNEQYLEGENGRTD